MIDVSSLTVAMAQVGIPTPDALWNVLTVTGPVALILGYGLYQVNAERLRLQDENRVLKKEYADELKQINERLFGALNNAATTVATNTTSTEAVRGSLGTIVDYILRRLPSHEDDTK